MEKRKKKTINNWLEKVNFNDLDNWTYDEGYKLIYFLINNKENLYVNIISEKLKKSNKEVAEFIYKNIKFKGGNYFVRFLLECEECGNYFEKTAKNIVRSDKHFCSNYCNIENQKRRIEFSCVNCGKLKSISASKFNRSKNNFCSHKCADEYNGKLKDFKIELICKECGSIYKASKYRKNISKFCSNKCKNEYQKKITGFNNPLYNHKEIKCDYCGKIHLKKPSTIIINNTNFCSVECRKKYAKEIYTQKPENKDFHRNIALKMLEDGKFSHTNTKPQIIINNVLDDLNVKYVNEKIFGYYAMDNYLYEYNLCIEVMGDFWHCNSQIYKEVNYIAQSKSIKKDKAKKTYLKNKYNIDILYLWEKDIYENIETVKNMIIDYIEGKITCYNSFNYINNIKLKPYMDWDIAELNKITNLNVIKNKSKRQDGKHEIISCDYCGKEYDILISKNRNKSHCCSHECSKRLKKLMKWSYVKCDFCGKFILCSNSNIKRNHKNYCNREHYDLDRKFNKLLKIKGENKNG